MKAFAILCGSAVIALSTAACNQTPPAAPDTHDADVRAISDTEAQANQAWAAKDLERVMAFYADDAVLMTPSMEAVHGKDGMRAGLKDMLADPAVSLTFQSSKVDVAKSRRPRLHAGVLQADRDRSGNPQANQRLRQLRNHVPQTGRRLVESCC